jgi:outer membrane protein assembly factor BamB
MNDKRKSTTDRAVRWGLGIGAVMIVAALLWQQYAPVRGSRGAHPTITKKWDFSAGGGITGALALANDGTLYAASKDGFVYALDGSGNLKWKFQTGPMAAGPAIGPDGTIYVTDEREHVYAINPNGTQQWIGGGGPNAEQYWGGFTAALDQNYLYTAWEGQIHAFRLSNGDGETKVGAYFTAGSSVVILPNGLVVHEERGRLQAVGPDGNIAWQYPELTQEAIDKNGGFPPPGNFWLDSPMAVGSDGAIYACAHQSSFVAIDDGGGLKWEFKPKDGWSGNRAAPVIASDGTIYFHGWSGDLYALNPDGTQKSFAKITGEIDLTPVLAEDGTMFAVSGSKLLAISPQGKVTGESDFGEGVQSAPTLGPDGTVYLATMSGKILAFDGGHGTLMDSPWPKFQRDLANTGRAPAY